MTTLSARADFNRFKTTLKAIENESNPSTKAAHQRAFPKTPAYTKVQARYATALGKLVSVKEASEKSILKRAFSAYKAGTAASKQEKLENKAANTIQKARKNTLKGVIAARIAAKKAKAQTTTTPAPVQEVDGAKAQKTQPSALARAGKVALGVLGATLVTVGGSALAQQACGSSYAVGFEQQCETVNQFAGPVVTAVTAGAAALVSYLPQAAQEFLGAQQEAANSGIFGLNTGFGL